MKRREFLKFLSTYLVATSATCAGCSKVFGFGNDGFPRWGEGSNSFGSGFPEYKLDRNFQPSGERFTDSDYESTEYENENSIVGCNLSAAAAESMKHGFRLLNSSGHPGLDQGFYEETYYLSGFIGGYSPSFSFYDDSAGSNAVASPTDLTGQGSPHGAVMMGVNLVSEFLDLPTYNPNPNSNSWAVGAVLGHEWAHIAQYANNVPMGGPIVGVELAADMVSGWFLAKRLQTLYQTEGYSVIQSGMSDQTAAVRAVYSIGDTNFTDPQHHGTHEQRASAFLAGHNIGMQGGSFEQVFYLSRKNFSG